MAVLLLVGIFFLLLVPRSVSAYYEEKIGEVEDTYYVPIFLLHDPPGEDSYSTWKMTVENTHGVSFDSESGVVVQGSFEETWKEENQRGTSAQFEVRHKLICFEYNITWEIWFVMTPVTSYYKLILDDISELQGKNAIWYDNAEDHNAWVSDPTGTSCSWWEHRDLEGPVEHAYDKFTYSYETENALGAGITVSYGGLSFSLEILAIEKHAETFEATYFYRDSGDLDFYINSNNDWSGGDDEWDINGIGIWFS